MSYCYPTPPPPPQPRRSAVAAAAGGAAAPQSSREILHHSEVLDFSEYTLNELQRIEKHLDRIVTHIKDFRNTIDEKCYQPLNAVIETAPVGPIDVEDACILIDIRLTITDAHERLCQGLDIYSRVFKEVLVDHYIAGVNKLLEDVTNVLRAAELSEEPSWREPLLPIRTRLAETYQSDSGGGFSMYSRCLAQLQIAKFGKLLRDSSLPPRDMLSGTTWAVGGKGAV